MRAGRIAPTPATLKAPTSDRELDRQPDVGAKEHSSMVGNTPILEESVVLHYAVVFFIIALVAALFGFGGIAAGAAGIAKILFVVFLIGALVTFVMSLGRRV